MARRARAVLGHVDPAPVRPHGATRQPRRARDRRRRRGRAHRAAPHPGGADRPGRRRGPRSGRADRHRHRPGVGAGMGRRVSVGGTGRNPHRPDPAPRPVRAHAGRARHHGGRRHRPVVQPVDRGGRRARDRHRPERAHPVAPRRPARGAGAGPLDQSLRGGPAGRSAGHAQPDRRRHRIDHVTPRPSPRSPPANRMVGAGDPRAGRTTDVLGLRSARRPDGAGPGRDLPVDRGGHRLHGTDLARPGRLRRPRCPPGGEVGPRRPRAPSRGSRPDRLRFSRPCSPGCSVR